MKEITTELIIVDTGSTDRTIEIAKKYTEKIYTHKWNNNFSDMRNLTISYAKGEWILIIDADEELIESENIVMFLENEEVNKKYNTACIAVRNFIDSDKKIYGDINSYRIFKNDGSFHYEGSVHNIPVFKEPVKTVDSIILHYGYISDDSKLMEKKFERTSRLLKKELETNPDNIYYRYQLSVSYGMYKKWEKAEKEALKAYALIKNKGEKDKREYFYLYSHLMIIYKYLDKYDEIIYLSKEALELQYDDIDSNFFMADALIQKGMYKEALSHYLIYLDMVKKYESGNYLLPQNMKLETIAFKGKVIYNIFSILYKNEEYKEILGIFKKYRQDIVMTSYFEDILKFVILSLIFEEKLKELSSIYKESHKKLKDTIEEQIESNINLLTKESRQSLYKLLSDENSLYGKFNMVRVGNIKNDEKKYIFRELKNNFRLHYVDVLIMEGYEEDDFNQFLNIFFIDDISKVEDIISRIDIVEIEEINTWIRKKTYEISSENLEILYIKMKIQNYYLLYGSDIDEKEKLVLFKSYIDNGYLYVKKCYREYIIEDSSYYNEMISREHRFIINMKNIFNKEDLETINLLKESLDIYPEMSKYIKMIVEEMQKKVML